MLYDISPLLHPGMAVWPGDVPFTQERTAEMAAGAAANVSAFRTTTHAGCHVDAPLHTEAGGSDIASLGLAPFLGLCRVVEVPAVALLLPEHLPAPEPDDPPRLLLKTGSWPDRDRFPATFTALSPEVARELAARGLLLVGLDTPSVDPAESADLPAHHALAGAGIVILEGAVLDAVPPGRYELIALPLKLAGLDASPVRAVLVG
ncbi:MAG TPA: cyclase family protein [Thermoanaerobaculia bacterium]|nr:cyclase family protein [Thermoanaerobaculia bacterium]